MVFYLLENIYSAFDKIADARKVFKVETIGDCCKCQKALILMFPVPVGLQVHALSCRRRGVRSSRAQCVTCGSNGQICQLMPTKVQSPRV
jgi:Adenylate and Guanylate cyclase catalytic domain